MVGGLCVTDVLVDNNSRERINFLSEEVVWIHTFTPKVNTRALLMIQPRKRFVLFQTFWFNNLSDYGVIVISAVRPKLIFHRSLRIS